MFKNIFVVIMLGFLFGCQSGGGVKSSTPGAASMSTGEEGIVSFSLQRRDFEYASSRAVKDYLNSPLSTKPGGKRWVVQLGEVINDTTLLIDTASMTSLMKIAMTNSGKFVFTSATGSERSAFVKNSRSLKDSKMFNQATVVGNGTVVAPDLSIEGAIRQRTVVDGGRGQQQVEYEFDFIAVENSTGLQAFQTLVPIDKLGPNDNFAW